MFQLIYLAGAVTDLQEAASWYEQQQAGRGHKFLQCIKGKLAYLQRYAASYPLKKGWFREFFIREYPYVVVYRLNRRKNHLVICSVFHTSRNPAEKFRR